MSREFEDGVFAVDVLCDDNGFVALPFRCIEEEGIEIDWGNEVESLKDISVEIASRIVDTLHLFVQKNESEEKMHRELIVPRMSYTAKLAHLKEEELGIVVTEKAFLKATLYALLQSMLRIVQHN